MKETSISRATAEHYSWGLDCDGRHLAILSGKVTMQIEHEEMRLHAGEGLHILPRVRHRITNRSGEAARFLVISQQPSHGDRVCGSVGLLKLPL